MWDVRLESGPKSSIFDLAFERRQISGPGADADLVIPTKRTSGRLMKAGYGAYPERLLPDLSEKGVPAQVIVRGAIPDVEYEASWFNRNGQWTAVALCLDNTAGRVDCSRPRTRIGAEVVAEEIGRQD
jgi:hypothetical protein